jgi:hypothetical protein
MGEPRLPDRHELLRLRSYALMIPWYPKAILAVTAALAAIGGIGDII